MKKTFAAFVAVATIAGSLAATPASAQRGVGAAAGGLIGGALLGGAIAASPPPSMLPPLRCMWKRRPRWVRERYWDGYGWRVRRMESAIDPTDRRGSCALI
jgi:hypothetical protein